MTLYSVFTPTMTIINSMRCRLSFFAISSLIAGLVFLPLQGWSQSRNNEFHPSDLPSIGNPADQFLSPFQESKLGAEFYRNVYRAGAVLEDPEISNYVQHLGNVLVNSLASGEHEFTFFVVNDNAINAFAVPGGYVGVNAGLILASNSESQLASVVAHEIAHVSQRHIARRIADMKSSQIPTLGAMLAGILLAASGSGEGGTALMAAGMALQQEKFLSFSRAHEIEADRIGLGILFNAGFDPSGMPEFFRNLQRQRFSPDLRQFAFLMTHPLDHVRIAEAQGRINRLPKQDHTSSSHYQFAKARLQALTSKQPHGLVKKHKVDLKGKQQANLIDQYAYSQSLERANSFKEAVTVLNKIENFDRESIPLQLAKVRVLMRIERIDEAIDILRQLKIIYPDDFSVNFYYATALLDKKEYQQGSNLLKQYLLKNPSPILQTYKLMAELHAKSGQEIESKLVLSDYYFKRGNLSGAVYQLREALKDPNIDSMTRGQIELRLRELTLMART